MICIKLNNPDSKDKYYVFSLIGRQILICVYMSVFVCVCIYKYDPERVKKILEVGSKERRIREYMCCESRRKLSRGGGIPAEGRQGSEGRE